MRNDERHFDEIAQLMPVFIATPDLPSAMLAVGH